MRTTSSCVTYARDSTISYAVGHHLVSGITVVLVVDVAQLCIHKFFLDLSLRRLLQVFVAWIRRLQMVYRRQQRLRRTSQRRHRAHVRRGFKAQFDAGRRLHFSYLSVVEDLDFGVVALGGKRVLNEHILVKIRGID